MGMIYKNKYKDKKTGEIKESAVYWIQYYRDGVPIRESSGTAVYGEAKTLLNSREGDIARGVPITSKMGRIKFSEMADDVINDYKANKRRSTDDVERMLEKHILPFFGEARASAITTTEIRKYITKRQEEASGRHGKRETSNGTINRELTVIKRAFSLGAQAGKIMSKPHITMLKENNVRKGFFDQDRFQAVRAKMTEDVQPLISFAYITGWRIRSEVQLLQWPQVDLKVGIVRLEPGTTKNDEARVFPLTRELRAVLESQKTKTDALKKKGIICPWVFHRNGKPIKEFRRTWISACKAAGVPGRIPHDFRRSAVRNLVRAGIPERVAMQMTGHKTRSVFERYNIVSEGDLFDAASKLDAIADKVSDKVTPSVVNGTKSASNVTLTQYAPVAQLDRATVS
jgi:integrase